MKTFINMILGIGLLGLPFYAIAETCFTIKNVEGYVAYSYQDYAMKKDRFSNPLTFCFEGYKGSFSTGTNEFRFVAENTWVLVTPEDQAVITEVWVFDVANRKGLFTRTRDAGQLFSNIGLFVGDIVEIR